MSLPRSEFQSRIERLRTHMAEVRSELFLIYGDEYRREHLRYVSNYWPIFERGMLVVGLRGSPILLVAPECFQYARETSIWSELRIVHEMEMAYVSDQIEYSGESIYTSLEAVFAEILNEKKASKVELCGVDAMSVLTFNAIQGEVLMASPKANTSPVPSDGRKSSRFAAASETADRRMA